MSGAIAPHKMYAFMLCTKTLPSPYIIYCSAVNFVASTYDPSFCTCSRHGRWQAGVSNLFNQYLVNDYNSDQIKYRYLYYFGNYNLLPLKENSYKFVSNKLVVLVKRIFMFNCELQLEM